MWHVFAAVVVVAERDLLAANWALPAYRHPPHPPPLPLDYSIDNDAAIAGTLVADFGSYGGYLVLDAAVFLTQDLK